MKQIGNKNCRDLILMEILDELKILTSIAQQNHTQRLNDTFSIKSQTKAAKLLGVSRDKLSKAIQKNIIQLDIDYRKTETGRYSFSDYLVQNFKGKI